MHGHFKRRLEQHLLLRGSRDFESEKAYDLFVIEVLEKAAIDRLVHRAIILEFEGESFRMKKNPSTKDPKQEGQKRKPGEAFRRR
jgi:DNA replication protein DnaC